MKSLGANSANSMPCTVIQLSVLVALGIGVALCPGRFATALGWLHTHRDARTN